LPQFGEPSCTLAYSYVTGWGALVAIGDLPREHLHYGINQDVILSTNFYITFPASNPLHAVSPLHIGQQAGGWAFSFRGYHINAADLPRKARVELALGVYFTVAVPAIDLHVTSWEQWKALLTTEGVYVNNEYGADVVVTEFIHEVETDLHPKHGYFNGVRVLNHVEELRKNRAGYWTGYGSDEDLNWLDSNGYSFSNYVFS
jgi:hypothetical protein